MRITGNIEVGVALCDGCPNAAVRLGALGVSLASAVRDAMHGGCPATGFASGVTGRFAG